MGRTTKQEILERFGLPATETSVNRPPEVLGQHPATSKFAAAPIVGTLSTFTYQYTRVGPSLPGGVETKNATISLLDGRLVMFSEVSNFPEDSTNFDEGRITLLKKGSSTEAEAIAALGEPAGMAIYPMTKEPGQKKLLYGYVQLDVLTKRAVLRMAVLLFDANGRLDDYWMTSSSRNPSPMPSQPTIPGANRI